MGTDNIGTVTAKFTADTRTFDVSVAGVGDQLEAAGNQAEAAAGKIAAAGEVVDRTARLQEQAKERARRAWALELQAQERATQKEMELSRAKELSALRTDIETRATEKAALAQERMNKIRETGKKLMEGLALLGVGLSLDFAVEGFKSVVESSMETGVELGRLHQQTGISVEDLSVLRFAAKQSGMEFDVLARGFKRLAVTVFEADNGNRTSAKGFEQLGISMAEVRAKGDDMYGVLGLISDKFKDMPDGITKSDAASKIFGTRMGSELIPILNQGSQALDRLKRQAPIFTDEDVERMHKLHQSTEEVTASWQRLEISLLSVIAHPMTTYLNDFSEGLDTIAESAKNAWEWTGKLLQNLGQNVVSFAAPYFPGSPGAPGSAGGTSGSTHLPAHGIAPGSGLGGGGSTGSGDGSPAYTGLPGFGPYDMSVKSPFDQVRSQANSDTADRAALARQAAADAIAQWNAFQMPSVAAFGSTQMPNVQLGTQPLEVQAAGFIQQMGEGFDEWIKKATDLKSVMTELWQESLDRINDELVKMMTTQYRRGDWKAATKPIFTGLAKSGLEGAEGSLFKMLGLDKLGLTHGKLGSKTNPMYVKSADAGGIPGGASTGDIGSMFAQGAAAGGGDATAGGVSGFLGVLGGAAKFLGFMADGGLMSPGGFYLAGERGPELINVGSTSRIHSNSDTRKMMGGGDTHHHWNIDARGSNDPAAVERAAMRAVIKAAPHIGAQTFAAGRDYDARRPNYRG